MSIFVFAVLLRLFFGSGERVLMCGPLSEPCPGPEGAVPIQRENAGSVAVTGSGFAWHAAARRWDEELFAEGSARGFIDGGDGDGDGIPSRPTVRIVSGPEIVIPSNQKDVIAPGVTTQASNNCLSSVLHENRLFLSWRTAPYHFASPKTRLFVVSAELPSGASEGSDELPDLSGDFLSSLSFEKELEISVETDLREPQLISLDSGLLVLSFFEAGRVPWKFEPQRMLRVRKTGPGVGAWSDVEEWGDRGEILWAAQVENGTVFVQSYKGQHYSTGGEMGGIFVFLNRSSDGLRFSSVVADESAKENRISEKSEEETDLVVREKTASWDGEGSESREKKETQRDDDNVPLSGRLPMSRTRDRNQTKSVAVGNGEGDQSFSFFNVRHKSVSVSHLASESTQAQGVAGQPPSKPLWKYSGGASEAPFAFDLEGNLYSVLRNEDGDGSGWGSRTVVESREKVARCIWEGDGERGCTSSLGPLGWSEKGLSDPAIYESGQLFRMGNNIFAVARTDPEGPFMDRSSWVKNRLLPRRWHQLVDMVGFSFRQHRSALFRFDRERRELLKVLDLPGCGDTSFPSIVRISKNRVLVWNYSSPFGHPSGSSAVDWKCGWSWTRGQTSTSGTQIHVLTLEFNFNSSFK